MRLLFSSVVLATGLCGDVVSSFGFLGGSGALGGLGGVAATAGTGIFTGIIHSCLPPNKTEASCICSSFMRV